MPLINFRTNLTSLQYGADRPGGGSSGQPYMQFPIDNENAPPDIRRFYEINRTGLDFPVRGGLISQLVSGEFGVATSTIDRERIQKFFRDAPRGTAFIQKQVGLQATNPRIQVPNSLTFAGPLLGNAVLPVTNVYNPLNTLAQVQAMGTGAHFNRHGVGPTLFETPRQTYQFIVGAPENNTELTNRLSILRILKLIGNTNFLVNSSTATGLGLDPTLVDRLGISPIQNQLFNYPGGPGSVYGIGFTRVFRYTDTNVTKLSETRPDPLFTNKGILAQPYSAIAFSYQQIAEQNTRSNGTLSPVQAQVQDFRNQLPLDSTARSDYRVNSLIRKYNVGNPGAPTARVRYNDVSSDIGTDKVNQVSPFYFNPNTIDPWTAGENAGLQVNDLIKFAFECIDNDNPEFSVALIFRAFLEGAITDTNQGDYSTFKYLGRGETFRTYQGFDRNISFTFKVFVQSRQEMLPLYQKLNQLVSQVYPDYSPNYNLMRGNVVRLTIGDYIHRTPGFIENVNITIDNTNTPWEILLNEFEEDDVRQLPHMVTVQCNFRPIMDILPRKVSKNSPFVPLIANKDHYLDDSATTNAEKNKLLLSSSDPIAPAVQPGNVVRFPRTNIGVPSTPTVLTGRPVNL